jgi:hypothetical protein
VPTATTAPTTASASFGPHVNDIIGVFDHVQIMLDDNHAVATVDERVQHNEQPLDIVYVQPCRWFVQDIECAPVGLRDNSVASLTRCASPPDRVVAGWPNVI